MALIRKPAALETGTSPMPVRDIWSRAMGTSLGPSLSQAEMDWKRQIFDRVVKSLNLSLLQNLDNNEARRQIHETCERLMAADQAPYPQTTRQRIIRDIQDEILGLGPLENLLRDPAISDILVNGASQVYVERRGKLEQVPIYFDNDNHLLSIIDRIVSRVGRRIDESSPMVDARLPDGSRVNAIIPPLALDGPALSIRRFPTDRLTIKRLIELNALTANMAQVLAAAVRGRLNVLISGGTGTGKTTMLNCLSAEIPADERIVTIEDSAELQLQQPHVVRLETRPPNIEGRGEVTQRDLVRNCLRMRPDRIVLGEIRGGEALDMLQAMNTGHEGSISTVHANNPRDAIARLENMVLMAGMELPAKAVREQISSAIDVFIQVQRLQDGSRKVTHVTEVSGMEGDTITLQDIFLFKLDHVDEDGKVHGAMKPTGIRPSFAHKFAMAGIEMPNQLFGSGEGW